MARSLADRFWSKVAIGVPDECWEWTGGRHAKGYGCFRIGQKYFRSSRISWQLHTGVPPGAFGVLHKCDNPACCNPAHLFLGTQADNVKDMTAKGRRVDHLGEKHGRAKLDDSTVLEIRARLERNERTSDLALCFGVSDSTISGIKTGSTWRHLL